MKRGYAITIIVFLLISTSLVSVISAVDKTTVVNLKTDDYLQDILIRLKDPNMAGAVFESIGVTTDAIGRAEFEFTSGRLETQYLLLFIENGQVKKQELTEEYTNGGAVEIDLRENPDAEPIMLSDNEENSTETNNIEVNDSETNKTKTNDSLETADLDEENSEVNGTVEESKIKKFFAWPISGFTIIKEKVTSINPIYYYIFLVVLIGSVIFVFMMKKKEPKRDPDVEFIKPESKELSESKEERSLGPAEKRVQELEEELKKAKIDLEKTNSENSKEQKIKEMKDKLRKDKERLERLEKEE